MNKVEVKTERVDECPMCNSRDSEIWCKGKDRLYEISDQEFAYSQCSQCTHIYQSIRPLESEIHHFYTTAYQPYQKKENSESGKSEEGAKQGVKLVKKVASSLSKPINSISKKLFSENFQTKLTANYIPADQGDLLLDFGCGSEAFLDKARKMGWQTLGMDFSDISIDKVKTNGHKGLLYDSEKAWDSIEDGSVQFVRMNHVLEHLYHPKLVLGRLYEKMGIGAMIHIAIPNPSGLAARYYGTNWLGLDCPRHINLFNTKNSRVLLSEFGFSVKDIQQEMLTKDLARSRAISQHGQHRLPHDEIMDKQHDHKLANILLTPARIAASLSMADRFHVFATKP